MYLMKKPQFKSETIFKTIEKALHSAFETPHYTYTEFIDFPRPAEARAVSVNLQ